MKKELELWQFIHSRLSRGEDVMLLVVAESSGSSPGRAGYKMAVGADGELCGSIGGGVMEVNLVEQSRKFLTTPDTSPSAFLVDQVHQKNSPDASGMICSGRQTVVVKRLSSTDLETVIAIVVSIENRHPLKFEISDLRFQILESNQDYIQSSLSRTGETDFRYVESITRVRELYIIGGGHCALALSEMMSKLGFHISIFDDRPELNTIEKNEFANRIAIIEEYERIAEHVPDDNESYVVVMTLGYASDKVVIKQLCGREFKYFGVLGSKAKMATLMRELREEGIPDEQLERIRTPIGIPINSRTPEEIAVSIAAEIIKIKNSK
jgi:xanthine dehydrogenase accessory factor